MEVSVPEHVTEDSLMKDSDFKGALIRGTAKSMGVDSFSLEIAELKLISRRLLRRVLKSTSLDITWIVTTQTPEAAQQVSSKIQENGFTVNLVKQLKSEISSSSELQGTF